MPPSGGGQAEPPPLSVGQQVEGALHGVGHGHRVRRGVEHRRVAVRLSEALGEGPGGQRVELAEDAAQRVRIGVDVDCRRPVLDAEHLEQVELEIAQIAAEMPHDSPPSSATDR